jgi:Protein of unknown function (DUF3037)
VAGGCRVNGVEGGRKPFEYAVLRAMPRIDRGECVNVGVVLYCRDSDFLGAAVHLDAAKLRLLDPEVDVESIEEALDGVRAVCAGNPDAGRAGQGSPRARFGWLTAPRSTVVQPGPVHGGMTSDPDAELTRLLDLLVR